MKSPGEGADKLNGPWRTTELNAMDRGRVAELNAMDQGRMAELMHAHKYRRKFACPFPKDMLGKRGNQAPADLIMIVSKV